MHQLARPLSAKERRLGTDKGREKHNQCALQFRASVHLSRLGTAESLKHTLPNLVQEQTNMQAMDA